MRGKCLGTEFNALNESVFNCQFCVSLVQHYARVLECFFMLQ